MKKVLLTLCAILLLTGCGNKELNLNKVKENVKETNVFSNLYTLSSEDMKNRFSLDTSLAEAIVFEGDSENKDADIYTDFYIVVKEKDEKLIKDIDNLIDESFELRLEMYNPEGLQKVKNRLETTYNGYKIYISSSDNEKVLEEIKKSK